MTFHRIFLLQIFLVAFCFSNSLSAQELYSSPQGRQSRVSSFENLNGEKGAGGKSNQGAKGNAFESLAPGQSKVLLVTHSAGIIERIWATINDRSQTMLRSLRIGSMLSTGFIFRMPFIFMSISGLPYRKSEGVSI